MRKVWNNGKQTTIPKKILDELGEGNVIWKYENGRVYIEVEKQLNPVQAKIPYNKSGAKMNSADRIIMQRARDFNKRMLEDNKQLHKNINESKKKQMIRNGLKIN